MLRGTAKFLVGLARDLLFLEACLYAWFQQQKHYKLVVVRLKPLFWNDWIKDIALILFMFYVIIGLVYLFSSFRSPVPPTPIEVHRHNGYINATSTQETPE